MSGSDIEHFLQIVEVIRKTIDIMKKVDELDFLPDAH